MQQFQNFVKAADQAGVDIMLDAPFNHTAHDVELAASGQKYWGTKGSTATSLIRDVEARVFSHMDQYDMRASSAANIAIAPDRYDFNSNPGANYGKWTDVIDIYYGRYAALVPTLAQIDNYKSEADWFDPSVGTENQSGQGNGHFDSITQNVWRYFGDYLQFWLTQTGYPANQAGTALDSSAGVDGLRSDFAQGLPPQCLEYLINRTRSRRWDFIFMAESLDGGPVTYRAARHFDVLNENMIYDLHGARTHSDYKRIYNNRRSSYGQAAVLLNTSSQDEDNYKNPYEAFLRFAAHNTIDGIPMIFPGQELGLCGTIVPPNGSQPNAGPPYGYERFEKGFAGKPIPLFKDYNSMMPLWTDLANGHGEAKRLQVLYSMVGQARANSLALRSPNRAFLELKNQAAHDAIYAVAKFEGRNADPASSDVIFAFVNLTLASGASTPQGVGFDVNLDADGDGVNDFGIKPNRYYNVKNLAAYTGTNASRRDVWLWSQPRRGSELLENGVFVQMNRVPVNPADWATAPYEPQYLKLFDVPAP
jgi:glycosidase